MDSNKLHALRDGGDDDEMQIKPIDFAMQIGQKANDQKAGSTAFHRNRTSSAYILWIFQWFMIIECELHGTIEHAQIFHINIYHIKLKIAIDVFNACKLHQANVMIC